MYKKIFKIIAVSLSAVLITTTFSFASLSTANAATPKLSVSRLTVKEGAKKKITVKNTAKVKSVKWSINKKGKSIVKLSNTSKKQAYIQGKKTGTATVTAAIKTSSKTYKPTVKVTVTKKAAPSVTAKPTEPPKIYGKAGTVSAYDTANTNYTLNINSENKVHEISDMLYGIFIEDINFAADGGLYAEMVKNRSFEFTKTAAQNEKHGWSDVGEITSAVIKDDSTGCLNANNPNYMLLENKSGKPAGIANAGFLDGMSVTKDSNYKFSVWAKGVDGYTGPLHITVTNGTTVAASGDIRSITPEWKKYELTLTSNTTAHANTKLQVTIDSGKAAVDMVSLFPEDTYKKRANGLRKDLAEKLEALKPAFLRFPGGCVVEGASIDLAYDWKDSIGTGPDGEPLEFNGTYGDVAARKQGQNIWTDENATNDAHPAFMSYGLGFFEYFQFAEDIGAIGVPVINCGLSCMIQSNGSGPAMDTKESRQYIQDALDLVEFCRGDSTTKWGAVRTALGHAEPFRLKYIGIGNEQWGDSFNKRYEAFVTAFNQAKQEKPELYDGIELMFSAGEDDGDSDFGSHYKNAYAEAANWLKAHPDKTINDFAGAVDHHYYNDPDWFLKHADYYDEKNYSRDTESMTSTKFGGGINVFLGEYAARSNTLEAALAEAAYMTGLERNGDIVKMAAYAPLFGNITRTHWAPDLIWFNNHTVTASINYYVQQIFAKNAGTTLLQSDFNGAAIEESPFMGKVGVGTWSTSATFDNVKIVDNNTGKVLAQDNFSKNTFTDNWEKVSDGNWSVKKGKLVQSSTSTNTNMYATTGTAAYFGNDNWKNYTYTLDAVKTGGDEGFLIPFAVGDSDNNYFWNIGGWNNTVSCLQQVKDGVKSDQISGTIKNCRLNTGETYKIKVVVTDDNVKCYLNNTLYVDYDLPETANAESYQVVSTDESGDIIIKMVNVTGNPKTLAINIDGSEKIGDTAAVDVVAGDSLRNDNILEKEEDVTLKSTTISGITRQFNYTIPQYSVTVLRVKTN